MSQPSKSPFQSAHLLSSQPISKAAAEVLAQPWSELTFVGFDTETTGKYPISSEICEIGAVKWRDGKVVDVFETLIKPSRPMGEEVIAIHGITNEMVVNTPVIGEKISEFFDFLQGTIPVAHHAPFDLGFLAIEFEKAGFDLPELPIICSSLLSRKLFPESENHRLQTLIRFFELSQGTAHRAHDDARACLEVGLRCLERVGSQVALARVLSEQGGPIFWSRFSMRNIEAVPSGAILIEGIQQQKSVTMTYAKGSRPREKRRVFPKGIVRSLQGDFLVASGEADIQSKRFFMDQILAVESN